MNIPPPRKPLLLLSLAALVLAGCFDPAASPPAVTPAVSPAPSPESGAVPPEVVEAPVFENWEVFKIGESKVGHGHTRAEWIEEEGRRLLKTVSRMELRIRRFEQVISQDLSLTSVETPEGRLVRYETRMTGGGAPTVSRGRVEGDSLVVEVQTVGRPQTVKIPWKAEWGGLFAAEQSLREDPLEPGETRRITSLSPFNSPAETVLTAIDYETTELLTGKHELLKIDTSVELQGNAIRSTSWADRQGEIVKTFTPGLNHLSFRTVKAIAQADGEPPRFDLGADTVVRVGRGLQDPHATKKIVYRAKLPHADPARMFVSGLSQRVKSIDPHTAEVTVLRVAPNEPADLPQAVEPPTEADKSPNSLVQADDEKVVALARETTPEETDPWKLAVALESRVKQLITAKNFSQAFASAAEVARQREGDCTEHAVLLAALCRARGIPARVAIGLVYYPQARGYAYHMWNEVWIEDRWVPLDATLARGGIGAAHLKLAESNLEGAGPYSAFLPVFQVLGQLELEIVEVE